MALDVVQFVDSIAASPTVRLDLNNENPWAAPYEGFDLSPPRLRRAGASTLLRDGATYPASAYDDRTIRLRLELQTSTVDEQASALQALAREVDRPLNFVRYQPVGMTHPVFFRTIRSDLAAIRDYPGAGKFRTVDLELLAEPFAYGLKESLGPFTVANDPVAGFGSALNANPFFEVDASNWTAFSGTAVRSTAQFHEGVASLLATPDGVAVVQETTSDTVPTVAGRAYRLSGWVRCAVARTIDIFAVWQLIGGGETGSPVLGVAVAANTWTFLDHAVTAPADTNAARFSFRMGSTPPAGHTLHIDEAMIREARGQQFDIAAGVVKGDVDTPCIVRLPGATINGGNTMVAVRHRDLSGLHYALQAEAATTLGADTTLQANDPAFSGAGSNYARTTFATQANALRLLFPTWPPDPSHTRYRGKYRILLRYRKNGAGDTDKIRVRLLWGGQSINSAILGDFVMLSTQVFGNGSFHWADLGVFQLPPSPDPIHDGYSGTVVPVKGVLSALQVERLTGTSTLDMDVLVAVPCDEDFAYAHFQPGFDGLSFPALGVLDGVWRMAYGQETDLTMPNHPACAVVGVFPTLRPAVANRVYVIPNVATFNPADSIATTMAVTVDYWPRYLSVKPVST